MSHSIQKRYTLSTIDMYQSQEAKQCHCTYLVAQEQPSFIMVDNGRQQKRQWFCDGNKNGSMITSLHHTVTINCHFKTKKRKTSDIDVATSQPIIDIFQNKL